MPENEVEIVETVEVANAETENVANAMPDEMLKIMEARQKVAEKINGQKVSDAIITLIQRVEMYSMFNKKDYYLAMDERGLGFFDEESYSQLVERTLNELKKYLNSQNLTPEQIEKEVDTYAANLVIHHVDFKSFSDEEVAAAEKRFAQPESDPEVMLKDETEQDG